MAVRRAAVMAMVVAVVAGAMWVARPGQSVVEALGPPVPAPAPAQRSVADAAKAARETRQRVEIAGLRGERQQVFANPDGTMTRDIFQQPVNVLQGGKWVPADATLVRYADGTVGSRAAETGLRLSGGGTGDFASIQRAGRRYALAWPGSLPEPVLDGATATYPEVLPGADLVVHARVTGFSHVLVIKNAAAARSPQVRQVRFGLHLDLLKITTTDNRVRLADSGTGETVFETPPARMWDSRPGADGALKTALGVRVEKSTLVLTPDPAVLDSPATVYPVYLDPFTSGGGNESWAMVDSGYPAEEYWKFDGETDERAGYCPVGVSGQVCNSSRIKRLFYVLPTSFGGMTILDAKFRVTMSHVWDTTGRNVSLYRAGSGGALITSATNWGNQPGGSGMAGFVKQQTIAPTGTTGCQTGATRNVEFNAQEAVATAAANGWSKTTFLIRSDNESDYHHLKRFCGNAVLSVTYNRAPDRPALSGLSLNPGGACVSGAGRPYVSSLPSLKAVLSDPDTADAEPLTAEFQVNWTAGGAAQSKSWTSSALGNGSTFTYNIADSGTGVPSLPENVVTSWRVRASDGTTTGPWSTDSGGAWCEFILDTTRPAGPDIDSPQYLPADAGNTDPACSDDATWYPGVGEFGTFTFDSAATDVIQYQYGFDTNPSSARTLTPATDGGPVSMSWQPQGDGPHTVNVVAVDHAGKQSDIASCVFRVAPGAGPVGDWRLNDAAGATTGTDSAGGNPLTPGAATAFGVAGPGGAADRAVRLDGTNRSGLSTAGTVVDTGRSYTVSAWVRPAEVTRYQTVLSQDGSGEDAFYLGITPANGGQWYVTVPAYDVQTRGGWNIYGPAAQIGKWTHLTVVFDAVQLRMTLYVNGAAAGSGAWRSPWTAHGSMQVGRRFIRTGLYGDTLAGDIADVQVWNRQVVPVEAAVLPTLVTHRLGYWDLDAETPVDDQPPLTGKTAGYGAPDANGGTVIDPALELGVYSGAHVYTRDPADPFAPVPLVGDGHLVLNGATGYAASAGPVAGTDGSFSVAARVQVATACTAGPMTVLSEPGAHAAAFTLGCVPDGSGGALWRVTTATSDANGAAGAVLTGNAAISRPDPGAPAGQFLVLTYDSAYQELKLYVDGLLAGTATGVPAPFAATGGLQVGRGFGNGSFGGYLAGVVDEVRAYSGPLAPTTIQQLNILIEIAGL